MGFAILSTIMHACRCDSMTFDFPAIFPLSQSSNTGSFDSNPLEEDRNMCRTYNRISEVEWKNHTTRQAIKTAPLTSCRVTAGTPSSSSLNQL